jgi:hypothetical protein
MNTRPMYETQTDLTNEDSVKQVLEAKWKIKLIKLPIRYGADYAAARNNVPVAFVEVKVLTYEMKKYPRHILSLHKAVTCLSYAERLGLPFYLVVRWTDTTEFVKVEQKHLGDVAIREGYNYRGDPGDIEPCLQIPLEDFKTLKYEHEVNKGTV